MNNWPVLFETGQICYIPCHISPNLKIVKHISSKEYWLQENCMDYESLAIL